MTPNSEAARTYLLSRRAVLEGRLQEIDNLLAELDIPLPTAAAVAVSKRQPSQSTIEMFATMLSHLRKAAGNGLTSVEMAQLMNCPNGTASGRMSKLKSEGKLDHIQPRYYIKGMAP